MDKDIKNKDDELIEYDFDNLSIITDDSIEDISIEKDNLFYKVTIYKNNVKEILYHRTKEGLIDLYKNRMNIS